MRNEKHSLYVKQVKGYEGEVLVEDYRFIG